jgi:hypothetical protein
MNSRRRKSELAGLESYIFISTFVSIRPSFFHIPFRFEGSASRVIQSFENILEQKIAAIAAFGVTITASAVVNNSTWPFVTVDQFQERSASSRSLSGCYILQMLPLVEEENRLAWEEYSVANRGWVTEARVYQAEKGLGGDQEGDIPTLETTIVSPVIFRSNQTNRNFPDPGVSSTQ